MTEEAADRNTDETTPLPGVKAHDPDMGTENPELSDEEVAERLERRDDVDSGDGASPEADDRDTDGEPLDPPLTPYHPGR